MKRYKQQLLVQSASNKACGQLAESSSSRLTPSPDLSPSALRLGQSADGYESRNPLASSLLHLYRGTDIAKGGGPHGLEERKAPDEGPEDSEGDSRCVLASFEESTSSVIAIAASFSGTACDPTSEDERGDLIGACSLIEGQRATDASGAAVVSGKVSQHREPSSPEVNLEKPNPLTGETNPSVPRAASEYGSWTKVHERDGRQKEGTRNTKLDSGLREDFGAPTPRPAGSAHVAGYTEADCITEQRNASFRREVAEEVRIVSAVRSQSILAGGIAAVVVGLLTVACVSPWSVEVASSCILGGLCICVLGWFAVPSKSPQLLVLHIVLLSCFLIMLTGTVALNVHWAVQSFRALRHAYFDVVGSPEGISPARARSTAVAPFSLHSTPGIARPNVSRRIIVGDKATIGLDYETDSSTQQSVSSTEALKGFLTLTRLQETEGENPTRTSTPSNKSLLHLPLSNSNVRNSSGMLQTPQPRRPTGISESPLHVYVGDSRFPNDSNSIVHTVGRRHPQKVNGFADRPNKADEVSADTPPRESADRRLNFRNTLKLDTSRNFVLPQSAGDGTVGQASSRSEAWRQPGASSEPPSALHDLQAPARSRVHTDMPGRAYLGSTDASKETTDRVEATMSRFTEDKIADTARLFSGEDLQDTPGLMLLRGKRVDTDKVTQGGRQSLRLRQHPFLMRLLDTSEHQHTRRLSVAVARGTGAAGLHGLHRSHLKIVRLENLTVALHSTPTIAKFDLSRSGDSGQKSDWRLEEGTVIPEPRRCDNLPEGLLKYVYSTRRQLETYGMICAFSRYNLWGLFDRWSVDCENGCGFKFLATKRYMWSRGVGENAAAAPAQAKLSNEQPPTLVVPLYEAEDIRSGAPKHGPTTEEIIIPPMIAPRPPAATMSSNAVEGSSVSSPTVEYVHWHAGLPLDKQKACLEGALNIACSVVKSHYLTLLPPLAVLLVLASLILVGVGFAALKNSLQLRCVAARRR